MHFSDPRLYTCLSDQQSYRASKFLKANAIFLRSGKSQDVFTSQSYMFRTPLSFVLDAKCVIGIAAKDPERCFGNEKKVQIRRT